MFRSRLWLLGAISIALVAVLLFGALWLERPALGLTLATFVACLTILLTWAELRRFERRAQSIAMRPRNSRNGIRD